MSRKDLGNSERVQITLEWVGGAQTQDIMIRPVAKLSQLSYYPQLCERISQLADLGLRAPAIAKPLNSEGFHPAKHYPQFSRQGVADLMRRLGLRHKRSCEPVTDGRRCWRSGGYQSWLARKAHASYHAVCLGSTWFGPGATANTTTRALDCVG